MKLVAFHLPQFHPIPENDQWWEPGFTEWHNVARARALFWRHDQPKLPSELGYYDLRVPEVRERQAELASWAGVSAFCYYHYWFAGKRLLERPVEAIRSVGRPVFPYCLCWANEDWTMHWVGKSDQVLMEQTYPGAADDEKHFRALLAHFEDPRYLRVRGWPLFVVFRPERLPAPPAFVDAWQSMARKAGLGGLTLVGISSDSALTSVVGFDAIAPYSLGESLRRFLTPPRRVFHQLRHRFLGFPRWVVSYSKVMALSGNDHCDGHLRIPTVVPNWDNTPRLGRRGLVLQGATPERFADHFVSSASSLRARDGNEPLVFLKSWNEWAEGNYVEPDVRFGRGYLAAIRGVRSRLAAGVPNGPDD
jgi:hypothetical protein